MPIDTKHPQWQKKEYSWFLTRTAVEGQAAIKRANSLFLPMPSAMAMLSNAPGATSKINDWTNGISGAEYLETRAPNYHPNAAYSAYKARAQFPDMTAQTLRGLVGLATKQDPIVSVPPSMQYLVDEYATVTGLGLVELYRQTLQEVLMTGRYILLTDIDLFHNRPMIVPYVAESLINWRSGIVNGRVVPTMLVFEESVEDPDRFSHDTYPVWRVLEITDSGTYASVTMSKELDGIADPSGIPLDSAVPSFMGRALGEIPITIIGATNYDLDTDIVPLEGVADIAIHIYMKSADIGQSQFMTANPTLVYSGIEPGEAPTVIGPLMATVLPNEAAKAYYVETSGNGIASMQESVKNLEMQAVNEGAALLGPIKRTAEAPEAVRLQQEAAGATLVVIAKQCAGGIEKQLKLIAAWMGEDPSSVSFTPNLEFSDVRMTAAEQNALLQSWMNKGISYETYYSNLQASGIAPEDRTADEERALIEAGLADLPHPAPIGREQGPSDEPAVDGSEDVDEQPQEEPPRD